MRALRDRLRGLGDELLEAEQVVNEAGFAVAGVSPTAISAVIVNDLFLMLSTLDSDRRPIPPNSTCEVPRTS
jgi:hypothetical protein